MCQRTKTRPRKYRPVMSRSSHKLQLCHENPGTAHRFNPRPCKETVLGSLPSEGMVVTASEPLFVPACLGENVINIPHEPPGVRGVEQPEWFSVKSPVMAIVMLLTAEFV